MMAACGPFFWILAAMGAAAMFTYFERLLELRRAQIDYQDFVKGLVNVLDSGNDEEALEICEDAGAPVAQVAATAIRHRREPDAAVRESIDATGRAEIARLDRRLAVLAVIGQIAPLMGLLGTIVGFVRTLMAANAGELVVRADLLNGAMESMVAAAAGLAVAIPALVMHASLRNRLNRIAVELESAASLIVGYLSGGKADRT